MRASSELQFGALREMYVGGREYFRGEPGGALSGGYAPDSARAARAARSSTSQGSTEPLCAGIKVVNQEVSKRQADL